jgi:hypothetical protein
MTNASEMKEHYRRLARQLYQRSNIVTRDQALPYVSFCVDDALSMRSIDDMPSNARLIGWQCGFEPMFVAVWSYLNVRLDDDDAAQIAINLLEERSWFTEITYPDFII